VFYKAPQFHIQFILLPGTLFIFTTT